MGRGKTIQFDFSKGELDPKLYGRADQSFYYQGCKLMENFYPLPEGGFSKMPGSVYAGEAKQVGYNEGKLIPFVVSATERFILELGVGYIRFWKDGELVESDGTPYELSTSMSYGDIKSIKYVKIENCLYLAGPQIHPKIITYVGAAVWTIADIVFTDLTFTGVSEYPSAIGVFEQRLILAGSMLYPNRLWISKTGAYTDYSQSSPITDDEAIIFDMNGPTGNKIQWIECGREVVIGCIGGEAILSGSGAPITPTNFQLRYQSRFGSCSVQGQKYNESILYLQRNANILRDYYYEADTEAYKSPEVTFLSKHILRPGVVDSAIMDDPYQIYWALLSNGELAGIQYNKVMGIIGTFKVKTEGFIEAIAVIPGNHQDDLWMIVTRDSTRMVEYFKPFNFGEQEDAFFIQSGITFYEERKILSISCVNPVQVNTVNAHGLSTGDYVFISGCEYAPALDVQRYQVTVIDADSYTLDGIDGTGFTIVAAASKGQMEKSVQVVTGLNHLEGKSVDIYVDGGNLGEQKTVTGGQIDMGLYGQKIHVGLNYRSLLKTMDIETGISSIQVKRRINKTKIHFYETVGGRVGLSEEEAQEISFTDEDQQAEQAPEMYTGYKDIDMPSGWSGEDSAYFIHEEPSPCTVLGWMFEINISEG